jgi:type II secretory pathway component PulM
VNRNEWVRQAHRWLSITFTVAVIANIVLNLVAREQKVTLWVGLLTLLPLALLLLTGLYLFVLPYAARRRSGRRTD